MRMAKAKTLIAIKLFFLVVFLITLYILFFHLPTGEIDVRNKLVTTENFDINKALSASDKFDPICANTSLNQGTPMDIEFESPVSFRSFSLYFPGNHLQQSYAPSDFQVAYYDGNNNRVLLKEEKNNQKPFYHYSSGQKILTSHLEILITKPLHLIAGANHGLVCYSNLRFFENNIADYQISYTFWHYLVSYLFLIVFLFLTGRFVFEMINRAWFITDDVETKTIFSPLIGLITLVINVIIYLVTGQKLLLWLFPSLIIISTVAFILKPNMSFKINKNHTLWMMAVALLLIYLVSARKEMNTNFNYAGRYFDTQSSIIIPTGSYFGYFEDNMFPWKIARFYWHRYPLSDQQAEKLIHDTSLFERTPILPLSVVGLIRIFGEGLFVYQRFLEVLTAIFLGSVYFLITKVVNKKIGLITTLLFLLNIQHFSISFNSEYYYKYFAVYPLLIATYLLFKTQNKFKEIWIGLLLMIAFLIHPFTFLISLAILALQLIKNKSSLLNIVKIILVFLALISLLGLWFSLPKIIGYKQDSSIKSSRYLTDVTLIGGNIFKDKLESLAVLIVPNYKLLGIKRENGQILPREYVVQLLRFGLIFNMTPLFSIYALIKVFTKNTTNTKLLLLGLLPLIFHWLLYLHKYESWFNMGGIYFFLFPYCLPMLLSSVSLSLTKSRLITRLILVSSYLFFVIVSAFYLSDYFNTTLNPANHDWLLVNKIIWLMTMIVISVILYKNIIFIDKNEK